MCIGGCRTDVGTYLHPLFNPDFPQSFQAKVPVALLLQFTERFNTFLGTNGTFDLRFSILRFKTSKLNRKILYMTSRLDMCILYLTNRSVKTEKCVQEHTKSFDPVVPCRTRSGTVLHATSGQPDRTNNPS